MRSSAVIANTLRYGAVCEQNPGGTVWVQCSESMPVTIVTSLLHNTIM